MSELLDHMLHDAQLHPDVALVNGISVLLTLLEVRKGRWDCWRALARQRTIENRGKIQVNCSPFPRT